MIAFSKKDFGPGFRWGVATAAYQIEGAVNEDGRSPSIWDTFSHTPGKIKTGENGDVACDFYHRYREDIAFIREMNMQVNRFSLAWPRILPEGTGPVNPKGLDYYHRVIDRTLELGLEPWVTLYHWDLPQVLEDKGGWTNRDILGWFAEYVEVCSQAFGDKVKHWMVLNEPTVFTVLGYMQGTHAPGRKGFGNFLPAIHHAAMAQAEGGRILRAHLPDAQIGTTFSAAYVQPAGPTWLSRMAAANYDVIANRLFIEPALGLGYPWKTMPFLRLLQRHIRPGDMEKLAFDFDFIGLQTYFRQLVRFDLFTPGTFGQEIPHAERGSGELTEMGWEVWPENIYLLLKQFSAYKGVKRIIITENGAAFPDTPEGERVHDPKRLKYIQDHLAQVLRARREGVPVEGYFYWSLMDNFEWAEGYKPRFGLVYIDYPTQKRILKDSGRWFKEFLSD
ncbi:GH1 family beta-glucosidase [Meiothermus sp.]|uniref:GH1 family beta-glucosidase n=1 Tax=Meiothermus sp. TaxID=1955249 RepID=UPI0021DDC3EC|nr:GH1 family beta-glucosidase [Meiothermus sp.]GIW34874.1 MAG: beta-glucosidase [Meiothermus sp.]